MDKILQYILLGICVYFMLLWLTKIIGYRAKQVVQIRYEQRQLRKAERKKERAKWRYARVKLDNPLLNQMMKDRTIVFMGHKGKGKSLMMNLVAHFLWKKRLKQNKKNKRYNKYKNPGYLIEEAQLKQDKLLPIYSNLKFVDTKKQLKTQELIPYFEMQLKAVEGAIFCIDEISSLYGKDIRNDEDVDENTKKSIKENSKKNRHYTDGWILATEQDGEDIYKGIRENGYALVNCLETVVSMRPWGKFVRKLKNAWNLLAPGFLTTNFFRLYKDELFVSDKLKLSLKLLLPSYITLPVEYYSKKQAINNKIKRKYQRYTVRFTYGTGEYWIRFSNRDIFEYDTRAYKQEYKDMFDEEGKRRGGQAN